MNRLIKYADKGENVSLLQTHLNSLGYQLKVDGIFGKETLKALNKWTGNNSTVFDVSTLVCNLKLVRTQKEDCTIGDLFINEEFICNTLEDVFREKKIANETCIPYGNYDIILLINIITHSLIMTIIYTSVSYFVIKLIFYIFNIKQIK